MDDGGGWRWKVEMTAVGIFLQKEKGKKAGLQKGIKES